MNVLRIQKYFLEATGKSVYEFLQEHSHDLNFYCNKQIKYCKERNISVTEHIKLDPDDNCFEVSYTFHMSDEELTLFLIHFPDNLNFTKE